MAEEDGWARDANAQRVQDLEAAQEREESNRVAGQVGGVVALGGLLTVFFGYLTAGRAHPVHYRQTIDSTLPEESPALVSHFYHGKQVHGAALGATLFDLARRGIVSLEQDPTKKKWYEPGPNFTIRLDRQAYERQRGQLQPYESGVVAFLFEEVAQAGDVLHSRQLRKAKGKMQRWFKKWKTLVRSAAGDAPYYDAASKKMTAISALVAGGIIVTGIVLLVVGGARGLVAVVAGVVCLALSFAILRLTPEAKLRRMKLKALRAYLKNYQQGTRGRDWANRLASIWSTESRLGSTRSRPGDSSGRCPKRTGRPTSPGTSIAMVRPLRLNLSRP